MPEWLSQNLSTVLVTLALVALVGFIIFKMVKDKKAGKSSCGCGCSGCALSDKCRGSKRNDE